MVQSILKMYGDFVWRWFHIAHVHISLSDKHLTITCQACQQSKIGLQTLIYAVSIDDRHMERLKKIAESYKLENKRNLMCSLVYDEMHIRQQVCWSVHEMKYVGHVNYGSNHEEDDENQTKNIIAKQAIVFLLNGIDVTFEFPLGYYFINELVAADRKHLLENVIAIATRCGIKITNLTFDGHSANVPACELLGAKLNVNVKGNNRQFKPFIINPINDEKIYIILDPSHMEKLVRNRLASCEVFFDSNGNKIEWRYILQLYEFSNKNDFHAHKLTKKHIEWKQNAMNVRLAAETFSESVAGCIEFLMKQKFPGFEGAQATIDFIRRMDRLFNVFNSTQSNDKNIYKRPLSPENKRIIFDFIQDTTEFFRSLRVEEVFYKKLPKGD